MDSYISMQEVCLLLKISRRVIQGYQKEKLISPKTRNKYGYLLFSTDEVNRIIMIRFLQNIGFSLKEIHSFIDDPSLLKATIKDQIEVLHKELNRQKELISVTEQIINALDDNKSTDEIINIIRNERSGV